MALLISESSVTKSGQSRVCMQIMGHSAVKNVVGSQMYMGPNLLTQPIVQLTQPTNPTHKFWDGHDLTQVTALGYYFFILMG